MKKQKKGQYGRIDEASDDSEEINNDAEITFD